MYCYSRTTPTPSRGVAGVPNYMGVGVIRKKSKVPIFRLTYPSPVGHTKHMDILEETIRSVLLTGHLAQHDPVSLLLIAAPESGKTSLVLRNGIKSAVYLTDVTGRGVQKICQRNPSVRHIVINDLIAVTAHKQSVSNYTIAMLNSMTEEGITNVVTPDQFEKSEGNGKRGVITSITTEIFLDRRRWWHSIGFTSRFLPFYYRLSRSRIVEIKELIDGDVHTMVSSLIKPPKAAQNVTIDGKMTEQIRLLSDQKSVMLHEIGFRRLRQFRAITRAHALLRHQTVVGQDDINFLMRLMPYVSFTEGCDI